MQLNIIMSLHHASWLAAKIKIQKISAIYGLRFVVAHAACNIYYVVVKKIIGSGGIPVRYRYRYDRTGTIVVLYKRCNKILCA